jgi:hypothetical protein
MDERGGLKAVQKQLGHRNIAYSAEPASVRLMTE